MTYYLNPYVIIIKRGNSCFYHFDNTLYHLTLKEYEMLINLSENQDQFSQERFNIFRKTKEYISNSEMGLTNRVSGKAVSIPPLFSYIGSELTKEIIFLLTNNENKVLYNDKIVIKDIFDNTTFEQNNLHKLVSFSSAFMVVLSMVKGDTFMIVPAVLLLFIFQIYSRESQKAIFITYLLISLILGILGLFRQDYILTNGLQTFVMIIFTLLSYVCYFSIILMLLKFAVTEILEKLNFGRN